MAKLWTDEVDYAIRKLNDEMERKMFDGEFMTIDGRSVGMKDFRIIRTKQEAIDRSIENLYKWLEHEEDTAKAKQYPELFTFAVLRRWWPLAYGAKAGEL